MKLIVCPMCAGKGLLQRWICNPVGNETGTYTGSNYVSCDNCGGSGFVACYVYDSDLSTAKTINAWADRLSKSLAKLTD